MNYLGENLKNMMPLPHEYMLVGILGFFITFFLVNNKTWSFTLILFFLFLIIASLISMTGDDMHEDTLDTIASKPYQRKKRKTLKR